MPVDGARKALPTATASQEQPMINLSVHAEFLRKGTADPFTGALLPAGLIFGLVLAAMLGGVLYGPPRSGPIEARAAGALVDSAGDQITRSPETGAHSN